MGVLEARILEWVTYPFWRGFSQPRNWTMLSCKNNYTPIKVFFIIYIFCNNLQWKIIWKIIYVYMYNWITLLCTWNVVSQLKFNKIYILRKKKQMYSFLKKSVSLWVFFPLKMGLFNASHSITCRHYTTWYHLILLSPKGCEWILTFFPSTSSS